MSPVNGLTNCVQANGVQWNKLHSTYKLVELWYSYPLYTLKAKVAAHVDESCKLSRFLCTCSVVSINIAALVANKVSYITLHFCRLICSAVFFLYCTVVF